MEILFIICIYTFIIFRDNPYVVIECTNEFIKIEPKKDNNKNESVDNKIITVPTFSALLKLNKIIIDY